VLGALLPGAENLQNIHPLVVHFPIALLSAAASVYLLSTLLRRSNWAWAALWMLLLGTSGAIMAVATGLYGAEGVMVAMSVREHLLIHHRNIMFSVLALSLILSVWALMARPLPERGRLIFLALLLVMAGMMAKGADYGGRMVYDYNAGGNACGQPIDYKH
jgi:uncharacterized membrane protein